MVSSTVHTARFSFPSSSEKIAPDDRKEERTDPQKVEKVFNVGMFRQKIPGFFTALPEIIA
jgi:hypothetical protein